MTSTESAAGNGHRRVGRDFPWLALVAVVFAISVAASWQRWADPIVDVGREMNQPLRVVQGEALYTDVRHIYGPLSPLLHAAAYRLFGPSLGLLYADGMLTAIVMLALAYWLARQVMEPAAAAGAAFNVMALCIFKPAGNYILPYSYNSLHGAALGLLAVATLVAAIRDDAAREARRTRRLFVAAGVLSGLAILAKTEMGAAAVIAGLAASLALARLDRRVASGLAARFVLCAGTVALAGYAVVVARVGWQAALVDSWLLLYNMPPEIAYFNGQISGLGRPVRSLTRMGIAAGKLGIIAAFIAAISRVIAAFQARRLRTGGDAYPSAPWGLLVAAAGGLTVLSLTTGLDGDKGPFLAAPVVLVAWLGLAGRQLAREWHQRTAVLVTLTAYSLASLARIVLHVRSGGAYASYLLPTSIVLFTCMWVGPFVGAFRDIRTARVARIVVLTLIIGAGIGNGAVISYRYQKRNTSTITTPRGTMTMPADMGLAIREALALIDERTKPGDAIAVLPEGTAITFLSGRRNPLREEIITPGYLDEEGEARAIRQLDAAGTALILIPNRPTREFGPDVFGRDYDQRLMRWIDARYDVCGILGPVKDPHLEIGDKPYFIRAYCAAAADQR